MLQESYHDICSKIVASGATILTQERLYSLFPALAIAPETVTVADFVTWISGLLDNKMMVILNQIDTAQMRVRDRIILGVKTRLTLARDERKAHKIMFRSLCMPYRMASALTILYRTCDHIWHWAGDVSTDFNFYTKRGLLMGVYASTYIFWLDDTSEEQSETLTFLSRQIDRVLKFGSLSGRFAKGLQKFIANGISRFMVR